MTRPELSVILTTPASRCLVLLLESAPEVVNQRDFFTKVWGEDGMLVPANTLYQNISIIRRGLRTTGETDDTLVATVPRKGFQIKKEVKVSRIENDVTESESAIAEAQPVTGSKEVIAETTAVQVKDKTPRHDYRRYLPLLFMALSFGLGYFILHLAVHDYSRKDFLKTTP